MRIAISLIVGIVVGWLVSMLINTDSREGLLRNMLIAAAGAYAGGWIMNATFQSVEQLGFGMLAASALGAAAALFLVKRFS